jgi:hypothetical protein
MTRLIKKFDSLFYGSSCESECCTRFDIERSLDMRVIMCFIKVFNRQHLYYIPY